MTAVANGQSIRARLRDSNAGLWFEDAADKLESFVTSRGGLVPSKELAKAGPGFEDLPVGFAETRGLLAAAGTRRVKDQGDWIVLASLKQADISRLIEEETARRPPRKYHRGRYADVLAELAEQASRDERLSTFEKPLPVLSSGLDEVREPRNARLPDERISFTDIPGRDRSATANFAAGLAWLRATLGERDPDLLSSIEEKVGDRFSLITLAALVESGGYHLHDMYGRTVIGSADPSSPREESRYLAASLTSREVEMLAVIDHFGSVREGWLSSMFGYAYDRSWQSAVAHLKLHGFIRSVGGGFLSAGANGLVALMAMPRPEMEKTARRYAAAASGFRQQLSSSAGRNIPKLAKMLTAAMGRLRPDLVYADPSPLNVDCCVLAVTSDGQPHEVVYLARRVGVSAPDAASSCSRMVACGILKFGGDRKSAVWARPVIDPLGSISNAEATSWMAAFCLVSFRYEDFTAVCGMAAPGHDDGQRAKWWKWLAMMVSRGHLSVHDGDLWRLTEAGRAFFAFAWSKFVRNERNPLSAVPENAGDAVNRWKQRIRHIEPRPSFMDVQGLTRDGNDGAGELWAFPPEAGDIRLFGSSGQYTPGDLSDIQLAVMDELSFGSQSLNGLSSCLGEPVEQVSLALASLAAVGLVKDMSPGAASRSLAWKRFCRAVGETLPLGAGAMATALAAQEGLPGASLSEIRTAYRFLIERGEMNGSDWEKDPWLCEREPQTLREREQAATPAPAPSGDGVRKSGKSELRERVRSLVLAEPACGSDLCREIGVSKWRVQNALADLHLAGEIKALSPRAKPRQGGGPTNYYASPDYDGAAFSEIAPQKKTARPRRRRGRGSRERKLRERIFSLVMSAPRCCADLAAELGIGTPQIGVALQTLRNAGRIKALGTKAYPMDESRSTVVSYYAAPAYDETGFPASLNLGLRRPSSNSALPRVLSLIMKEPVCAPDLVKAVGVSRERIRQVLDGLLRSREIKALATKACPRHANASGVRVTYYAAPDYDEAKFPAFLQGDGMGHGKIEVRSRLWDILASGRAVKISEFAASAGDGKHVVDILSPEINTGKVTMFRGYLVAFGDRPPLGQDEFGLIRSLRNRVYLNAAAQSAMFSMATLRPVSSGGMSEIYQFIWRLEKLGCARRTGTKEHAIRHSMCHQFELTEKGRLLHAASSALFPDLEEGEVGESGRERPTSDFQRDAGSGALLGRTETVDNEEPRMP